MTMSEKVATPDIVDVAAANPAVGHHVDGVSLMNALADGSSRSAATFCEDCREGAHDECRHNGGWLSDYNEDGRCLCHRLGHVG